MNYLEKVRLLIKLEAEQDPDDIGKPGVVYVAVHFRKPQWQAGELEDLLKNYPYVPESYKVFIEEFDSLGLFIVRFCGSRKLKCNPVYEEIEYCSPYVKYDYFPFAKESAGGIYCIYKDGSVVLFWDDDYEFEKPEKVADDFVDFIDNYVLGEKGCKKLDPESYEFFQTLNWD